MTDPTPRTPEPSAYLAELFSLDGRNALVTGGSSGIGFAIAEALARAGAHVVIAARDQARLALAAQGIRKQGGRVDHVCGDLGVRQGVLSIADSAVDVFGDPDIVVCCAAVNLRPPLAELAEDAWHRTMAVNLFAPFLLGQRFGPAMARRGFGRLIHVSSQQAHRAFLDSGAYGVSKAGLEGLTRSQAEAWSAFGVTSNAVVPGFVSTPLNAHVSADPARVAALAAQTTIGRNGLATDFAGIAVFLASRASAYLTGQSIFVDGGMSAH